MPPLTGPKQRTRFEGRNPLLIAHPAKLAAAIFTGALVCREAASNLAIPAADNAGLVVLGVAMEDVTATANGSYTVPSSNLVQVDHDGIWSFKTGATEPKAGDNAYVLDDNTLGVAADAANDVLVGQFLRPNPYAAGEWFVDLMRR